jgi:hypothetical protein
VAHASGAIAAQAIRVRDKAVERNAGMRYLRRSCSEVRAESITGLCRGDGHLVGAHGIPCLPSQFLLVGAGALLAQGQLPARRTAAITPAEATRVRWSVRVSGGGS